ncbi:MAG: shikimate dehydrogenase [Lachnospiraceae bacterium]|nr:shikimate dehydrogenase [Lachnospiraceae bacterium]
MTLCGLIGNPVEHSLSPVIHNTFSRLAGIDSDYRLFPIKEELAENLQKLYEKGLSGINVTVPYKSDVIPLLTSVDPLAQAIGAVNTLTREEQAGGFRGRNTDIEGLRRAISEEGVKLCGADCIILGAGGAARAAAFMLLTEQVRSITIANRSPEKAERIATDLRRFAAAQSLKAPEIFAVALDELCKLRGENYIAIQCTSVGLKPDSDRAVTEEAEFYKKLAFGFDVVYSPATTRFMQLCRENGVKSCNGLKMLLYQAVYAYELWHQVKLTDEMIREVYQRLYLAQMKNIVLIGFMGAGKTRVGRLLAERLGYRFFDTDELIEKEEGVSIPELFESKGEAYFRDRETETVRRLSKEGGRERYVLSVGGGLVVRECNRGYLKKIGPVVYLEASEETLSKRVHLGEGRPMLAGDKDERLHKLLESRKDIYLQTADIVIRTDELTIDEVVLKGERIL